MTARLRLLWVAVLGGSFALSLRTPVAGQSPVQVPRAVLTIYSPAGFALVQETRQAEIGADSTRLEFTGFPASLDPGTLQVRVGGGAPVRTLHLTWRDGEQEVSGLLERSLGQRARLTLGSGAQAQSYEGILVARSGGIALRDAAGALHLFPSFSHIEIAQGPAVSPRPALLWEGKAGRPGKYSLQIAYEGKGLSWTPDYQLTLTPGQRMNEGRLQLDARVRLENRSGASFPQAEVHLVAGTIRRAEAGQAPLALKQRHIDTAELAFSTAVQAPSAVQEVYEYSVEEPVDLPDGESVVLPWKQSTAVPYEQEFLYRGQTSDWPAGRGLALEREVGIDFPQHAEVILRFRNRKAHGLGGPLPGGRVRVGVERGERWVLVGEGSIPHVPAEETVHLPLGESFDVVGERQQQDYSLDQKARRLEEAIEVRLRNRKPLPVDVRVRETLYRAGTWEILEAAPGYEKKDARTIEFVVPLPAGGEGRARYRVRYSW